MDIRDYGRLLRLHWRLIALCTLLGIAAAAAVTVLATPIYQAQAQLFVSVKNDAGVSGLAEGSQFTQQRVKSYADIVASPRVTQAVIDQLHLRDTPEGLASEVSADNPLDTVLLNVNVKDANPHRAQNIANAVAQQFGLLVNDLETPQGGGSSPVKVSVVHNADLPTAPVSPRTKLNLALGLLVGLAVGAGGAVLRETLDTSVKTAEELLERHGAAPLGVIAYDPDASKHPLVVQSSPHSTRAEAFRQLRTNLQFIDVDEAPRSIVLTSSIPQEGKTTTTCNLAITLAQAGVRVVLVEGDLRRPLVTEYMGLEGAVGVTSVLIGQATLDDALQDWGGGLLTVLGSGPTPPNPSELLGSHGMSALIRDLEKHFELVIIDSPPLLPVTDAAVLGTAASGAVLVVQCGRTKHEQVDRALAALRSVDVQVFGAVLNMAPTKGPDAYRYGYGYGAYTQASTREATPSASTPSATTPAPAGASAPAPPPAGVPAPALTGASAPVPPPAPAAQVPPRPSYPGGRSGDPQPERRNGYAVDRPGVTSRPSAYAPADPSSSNGSDRADGRGSATGLAGGQDRQPPRSLLDAGSPREDRPPNGDDLARADVVTEGPDRR